MKRPEREPPPRQGITRAETPTERRQLEGLNEDLRSSPLRGRGLPLRLRNFRIDAGGYLASLGGPLPFMLRLREIDRLTAEHERRLGATRDELVRSEHDGAELEPRWRAVLDAWSFDDVNDLIDRHNRWYPIEARLPMDPKRGDFALVNGRDYRHRRLDADWAFERFPIVRPVDEP